MARKESVKGKRVKRSRAIAWCAALLLLIGALVVFNRSDDHTTVAETYPVMEEPVNLTDTVIGDEAGMYAPDFTAPMYGGNAPFVLAEQRGKIVILNFWATWCPPCCAELPYFDEIHRKYGDTVSVVAIHSDLVTDDVPSYLARFDYQMPFALDETGEIIKAYGGSTMLPQTVIIDEYGMIIYNAVGSLTLEKLEALLRRSPERTNAPPNPFKKPMGK
jgi:thiol-disulfide isomerase/thioredoxin